MKKFIPLAQAVAALSKDPRTKVGALVIDRDSNILSTGYNGFPRGVQDLPERYADREIKLTLTSHAEANAIAQAARNGIRLLGSRLLVTSLFPCSNCAKLIIQAGIIEILAPSSHREGASPIWEKEKEISSLLFKEAGVSITYY